MRLFAFIVAGTLTCFATAMAAAQDKSPPVVDQFAQICGIAEARTTPLPGNDVATSDAPTFFANDLRRAIDSRVVKVGEHYAMRAVVPSDFDPQHAVLVKCALGSGQASFSEVLRQLSERISAKPTTGKTVQEFDYAQFRQGTTSFAVFSESNGWVSIYRMDVMMHNIDPRFLKKGAKPVPVPRAQ
jgi:hypothetical protein